MSASRRLNEFPLWANLVTLFPLLVWRSAYDSFHEPKWHLLSVVVGLLLLIRVSERQPLFRPITPLELPICLCLGATLIAWRWDAPDRWVSFMLWLRLGLIYLLFRLWVSGISTKGFSVKEGAGFDLALTLILGIGIVVKEWVLAPEGWGPTQIWSLIVLFCLLLRCGVQHLEKSPEDIPNQPVQKLLDAFLIAGAGVAILTVLQDWEIARWSGQPVSDWRFHLSSTLGNPNEVGGYLSYLIPALIYRVWTRQSSGMRIFWGIVGLLYLYALTTVFTVGAWLGLFVILPISGFLFLAFQGGVDAVKKNKLLILGLPIAFFALLQTSMRIPDSGSLRNGLFVIVGAVLIGFAWLRLRRFEKGWLGVLMVAGLVGVWTWLLPGWGIPNHPQGLVQEAVSSPRWKGGFGARQFIWRTTGLMVKDHPIRGIGWGHYYFLHAAYQGALYSSTDKPHDRPTVGQVPQVHSDPLQVLAESGPLGSIAFLWLGFAAFGMGLVRVSRSRSPDETWLIWALWTGLGLIAFHSAVDFPLRQPQPALLAVFFMSGLSVLAIGGKKAKRESPVLRYAMVPLGLLFVILGTIGLRDQVALKTGFETSLAAMRLPQVDLREERLNRATEILEGIQYPLPETQDRWLYLSRVRLGLNDPDGALAALEEARKYRHNLALYQAWREYGQAIRSPKVVLDSVLGMIRYNPNWAGYHQEAAELWKLLGNETEAKRQEELAKKFKI
ncbi:MAG: O-antigen ligase family protein [Candidatus Omnitrophica bacterium]|nr:O-antigen ligase family protein [Candidatus Omnitrophota bacterium]